MDLSGNFDLLVSNKIDKEMEDILFDKKKKVYDIIKKNHKNEFENNSFDTNKHFENEGIKLLNNAINVERLLLRILQMIIEWLIWLNQNQKVIQ